MRCMRFGGDLDRYVVQRTCDDGVECASGRCRCLASAERKEFLIRKEIHIVCSINGLRNTIDLMRDYIVGALDGLRTRRIE
jgi:hypothetical protein